ncbi:hypothetical protein KI387_037526, partial [Taxus chinensis]
PKKTVDINSILNGGVGDVTVDININKIHKSIAECEKTQHHIAEKDAMDGQGLTEESSNYRTDLSVGSSDFDSAEIMCSKDYVDDEAECLASMFRVLDEDGDGRVSVDEIVVYLERLCLGMPKEEVELAVRSVSASGSEFLTATEFDEFYRIIFAEEGEVDAGNVEEKAICEAFGVFDQNGDGFISAMELADVLCRLGFVEGRDVNCCESMIENVDYNGDGFVDIHEFKHLIARKSTSLPRTCLHCISAVN